MLLASVFTNLLLAVTLVAAAAVAGLMAYHYAQARLRERRGISIAGPAADEFEASTALVRAERADEIAHIRQRIEVLMEQQQLQSETQSQHLVQKLDELKGHMSEQGRAVAGLRGEMRHEMRRRDAELDELRQQLATALDAFWKATPALAGGTPPGAQLALPPAPAEYPGSDAYPPEAYDPDGHAPADGYPDDAWSTPAETWSTPADAVTNDLAPSGSDGEAFEAAPAWSTPSWEAAEPETGSESAAWPPAESPPVAAPPAWGTTDAWTQTTEPAPPDHTETPEEEWADTSGWVEPPTTAEAPPSEPYEAAAPSWTLLDSDAPGAADPLSAAESFEEPTPMPTETPLEATFVPVAESVPLAPMDDPLPADSALPIFTPVSFDAPALDEEPAPAPEAPLAWTPLDEPEVAEPVELEAPAEMVYEAPAFEEPAFEEPAFEAPAFAPVADLLPEESYEAPPVPEAAVTEAVAEPEVEADEPAPLPAPRVAEAPAAIPEPVAVASTDDLTTITGVDAAMQARLNAVGVHTLDEMARWSRADARRISTAVDVPEETIMHHWIFEAQSLLFERYQQQMARQARPTRSPVAA